MIYALQLVLIQQFHRGKKSDPEFVRIRLFKGIKDWEPVGEMELRLERDGSLNLLALQERLGQKIQVRSSSVRNVTCLA